MLENYYEQILLSLTSPLNYLEGSLFLELRNAEDWDWTPESVLLFLATVCSLVASTIWESMFVDCWVVFAPLEQEAVKIADTAQIMRNEFFMAIEFRVITLTTIKSLKGCLFLFNISSF